MDSVALAAIVIGMCVGLVIGEIMRNRINKK